MALIAAIPFIQFSGAGIIAIAATGMIYFSYFLGNIAILRARLKGWPKTEAPFKLGKWGLVVNIVGLIYGGAMIVNFAWPRAASNPTPDQSGVLHLELPERRPDPLDGVLLHRPARRHVLPGRRQEQAARAGRGAGGRRRTARGVS